MSLQRRLYVLALLGLASLAPAPILALPQTEPAPAQEAQFEVASIRAVQPHTAEELQRGIGSPVSPFPANLFTADHMPLSIIISIAFKIDSNRITDKPDWLDSQLWQISAKVDGDAMLTAEQMRPLLQKLLRQRFHLAAHRESRLVPGYALVVSKGGAKLQVSKDDEMSFFYILTNGVEGKATSMATLAGVLETPSGRPVIDKTGIAGKYNIKLHYAPANNPSGKSDLPDFFTALQEQLGLKLEPTKVPVDHLVIDHVDKIPTEN
jgi:uncharacterized protein (TIGR03435 family)